MAFQMANTFPRFICPRTVPDCDRPSPDGRSTLYSLPERRHDASFEETFALIESSPTILQRIAGGEPGAVSRCLDEYGGLVRAIAIRYLSTDRSEVDDAVQDVFVSLWQAASRFDPARGAEAAFVAGLARRRIIDVRRRLSTQHRLSVHVTDSPALANSPTPKDLAELGSEVAKLPEDERLALWLAVSRGMSHREISVATTAPVGTVKSRLRRAVLRLQRVFGVQGDPVRLVAAEESP